MGGLTLSNRSINAFCEIKLHRRNVRLFRIETEKKKSAFTAEHQLGREIILNFGIVRGFSGSSRGSGNIQIKPWSLWDVLWVGCCCFVIKPNIASTPDFFDLSSSRCPHQHRESIEASIF